MLHTTNKSLFPAGTEVIPHPPCSCHPGEQTWTVMGIEQTTDKGRVVEANMYVKRVTRAFIHNHELKVAFTFHNLCDEVFEEITGDNALFRDVVLHDDEVRALIKEVLDEDVNKNIHGDILRKVKQQRYILYEGHDPVNNYKEGAR